MMTNVRLGAVLLQAGWLLLATGLPGGQTLVQAQEQNTVRIGIPAEPGLVEGTTQHSDEFIWSQFSQFAAPVPGSQPPRVVFETWATDADTFSQRPHWPSPGEPQHFHSSVLASLSGPPSPIDVTCSPPAGAAVGGFPTAGTPTPCIAEQVQRNRPQYDYIVNNHLNTQAGLADAFANGFKVTMPTTAIAVKGDWIPVQTLLQWIPELGDVKNVEQLYYTTTSDNVEYGLVSLHVSSRQNPNWVWGTFEHQMTPGRCDSIGCFDSFGAEDPAVLPRKALNNTQYGPCSKTAALQDLMTRANLSKVWQNYCLKGTEVDYAAADGTPYVLGNSVIEGITGNGTIAASSCIACHAYASFGPNGATSNAAKNILPFNPTGSPIAAVLDNSIQFDFMWGVILAPAGQSDSPAGQSGSVATPPVQKPAGQ